MPVMSPKLGEALVKATHSKDIDDALNKIFSEYLSLKLEALQKTVERLQRKWNMSFEEFKRHFKDGTLKKDTYSFSTEKDYWQWEEAETLKKHYEKIKKQWI
jgi:AraC-like DNA-binding protein